MKADDMLWRLVTGTAKRRKRTILTMLWLTMFLKSVYSDLINNKITISLLVIILSPNIYNKYKYTSIHFANMCVSFLSQSGFHLFVLTFVKLFVKYKSTIQILITFGFVHESFNA